MGQFKVFVVEDDPWYQELITYTLGLNPDFEIRKFGSGKELLDALDEKPNVITLDFFLPDMTGEEILIKVKSYDPSIELIVISEQSNIQVAVDLLKKGAYEYIVKSKEIKDQLLNTINHIYQKTDLKKQVTSLQKEVQRKYDFTTSMIGSSEKIKEVYNLIETAVNTEITVTVTGETGTGKELAAKAIHYNSKRKNGSFVAVNMAAIPKDLAESELFGHEKGSFTGANYRRVGKFEEADNGTLFLDEIGEIDHTLQVKLLRAIQEKEVTRVGSNNPIKTNCRIIVATNRDLLKEVKKGNFRDDLYYRLFGLTIKMPPLRERHQDVIILARHFISGFCKENNFQEPELTAEAQKKILQYTFPGNVRELKSIMELAVAMAGGKEVLEKHINFGGNLELYNPTVTDMTMKEHNDQIIKLYLEKYNNNVKDAAKALDISYSTIYRLLKERENNPD